jgi:phosphoribosylaminoimidazolecarboxamide formyltransferase / IMP cyclohydrolase
MPRALLSVSDKTGLIEFAKGLSQLGWELISTGGTARALREAGLPVTDVSELTQHDEMMAGRVKTLHPAVHAGLLARRAVADDMSALEQHGYGPIDLVVVNLYPFHEAVAQQAQLTVAMEKVDIGGPSMLRSAAKNHEHVLAVSDPDDYGRVLNALRSNTVDVTLRRELATRVFEATGRYDNAIADYFRMQAAPEKHGQTAFGPLLSLELRKVQDLRYGENPDQAAAFYAEPNPPPGSLPLLQQLHGKELSFNNILDIDAAVMAIAAWSQDGTAASAIIKHTTPSGVGIGATLPHAFERALASDPVSAFGGVVSFNQPVSDQVAAQMADTFFEVVVAPSFEPAALQRFQRKKNLRIITLPIIHQKGVDYKRVYGGMLVQQRMCFQFPETEWQVVTERAPSSQELEDLRFAWRVCAVVKSNAIVIAKEGGTLGIGAGQMSRVDASRIAVMKANDQKAELVGAALASDAFFPFRDGIDAAARAGIAAVIQPGGSVRDDEVIAAANEHGIAMIFTNRRLFRH